MKHQRQPVYSGLATYRGRSRGRGSSTSYSSHSDTALPSHAPSELPTLVPDPLAPPTSIDSPPRPRPLPRLYSATLPPPRTRTHAAATQTMPHSGDQRRKYL